MNSSAEVETCAELPYKGWSNQRVWVEVASGYRLECPEGCPQDLHSIMQQCWQLNTADRPTFDAIVNQLDTVLANGGIKSQQEKERQDGPPGDTTRHNMKSVHHPNTYMASGSMAYEQPEPQQAAVDGQSESHAYEQPTSVAAGYKYSNPASNPASRAANPEDPTYEEAVAGPTAPGLATPAMQTQSTVYEEPIVDPSQPEPQAATYGSRTRMRRLSGARVVPGEQGEMVACFDSGETSSVPLTDKCDSTAGYLDVCGETEVDELEPLATPSPHHQMGNPDSYDQDVSSPRRHFVRHNSKA